MRYARLLRRGAALMFALTTLSCGDMFEPLSRVQAPATLDVSAVRLNTVRLRWSRVDDADVIGYAIERRENLTGQFHEVVKQVPQSGAAVAEVTWLDTDVVPDTYYGYRVQAVTRFGDRSPPSVVGGAKSPPMPGIEVRTASLVTASSAVDLDGYQITIQGPDNVNTSIGIAATRRFSPLRVGTYQVSISGLMAQCSVMGATTKSVVVSDTLAQTITPVSFDISCKDPSRGEIAVTVNATGKELDNEVTLDLLGEASDATLPPSERVVSAVRTSQTQNSVTTFTNLRPGTYDITIEGLANNCTVTGTTKRTVSVTPLGHVTMRFDVACTGSGGGGAGPFVWSNVWLPVQSAAGTRVKLRAELDLTAVPAQKVQGVQAAIVYDATVLRFESATPKQLGNLTVNGNVPGVVSLLAAGSVSGVTGVVNVGELEFTVIGTSGNSTTTTTNVIRASTPPPATTFETQITVVEGTFTVGAGGGSQNQPPTARANGPYSGAVNASVSFSASGSSDPDGTIASYSWAFGDGQTGTGATSSHTYTSAGTYTATLTVTDDKGGTGASQATVTITGGGSPSNQSPIAEANGPYTATTGVAVTLSSAGSHDNDGSIASYSWTLGNGQTSTSASPSVTFATPGTYTATLTVTDDKGATGTDQATVTVSAPPNTQPMIWRAIFGPVDVANNLVAITVSYDMRADVPETPSAEALQTFVMDSLKWNPAVLQFYSVNLGPNITGTANQSKVSSGNIALQGNIGAGFQQGLITLATIRFKIVGTSGSQTTTSTHLGSLQGTAATGGYVYNAKTQIVEGSFVTP